MIRRRTFLLAAFVAAGLSFAPGAEAAGTPKVVASFSILGDIVKQIGGNQIELTTLVGPNGDAHVYQPTPADARSVADADLVIVNGLGFEGWLDRLISAAGYKGELTVATAGLEAIKTDEEHENDEDHGSEKHADQAETDEHDDEHGHHHGELDPHAWQSVANIRTYVENVLAALTRIDPKNGEIYATNAKSYLSDLDALDAEIRASINMLPESRRKVVTSHDAFGYFSREYGITFLAPVGMSTESEASAGDVAKLIRQIKAEHIPAVFVENITDKRLLEQVARETNAVMGGTLYSDALSGQDEPASTYVKMMRHNYRSLTAALGAS